MCNGNWSAIKKSSISVWKHHLDTLWTDRTTLACCYENLPQDYEVEDQIILEIAQDVFNREAMERNKALNQMIELQKTYTGLSIIDKRHIHKLLGVGDE